MELPLRSTTLPTSVIAIAPPKMANELMIVLALVNVTCPPLHQMAPPFDVLLELTIEMRLPVSVLPMSANIAPPLLSD
eukprot:2258270-Prymnesium_polylepis.1